MANKQGLQSAYTITDKASSIAGGVMSLNRRIDPMRKFVRAKGAYLWDDANRQYIDYHAAFAPYVLGHGDPDVDQAVMESIQRGESLIGAGATPWEREVADLIVDSVPYLEQVQVTCTGTEAVAVALRIARAYTQRDHIVFMQGGYNGWMDSVAFNLMDPNSLIGSHRDGDEHTLRPISAGMGSNAGDYAHAVEFNDVQAVENILSGCNVAAVILEPILQNIGIVKPEPGYLESLRRLCDRYGTLLIFDEVKTGFRHALGGYQSICQVEPDLSVFGKAVANGYPMGVIGGKSDCMRLVDDPDPSRKVLVAGTYNAHPIVVAAATATIRKLRDRGDEIYAHLERLGAMMEAGLKEVFAGQDYPVTIVRQGSAFVVYFMDHAPKSWKDIAKHNNSKFDVRYRKMLIENGIFHFPVETKQGSISFAHTPDDIERTLEITSGVVPRLSPVTSDATA